MGLILTMLTCLWTQNKPILLQMYSAVPGLYHQSHTAILFIGWVITTVNLVFVDAAHGFISFSVCFCLFMLNVLTFNSSTTNSALVIILHIYLYAYIPLTNYLNEPSPSGLVIHAFESVGDKGSQGVEESEES